MIAHLNGTILSTGIESVVIDVGGVGYHVSVPLSTYTMLGGEGEEVSIRIYTHVREDAIQLFGFLTRDEIELFKLLIGISGVGPKLAISILSGINAGAFRDAVASGDHARLQSIPGVGRKTAERIVVDLRDKVGRLLEGAVAPVGDAATSRIVEDVRSALTNLGYPKARADHAIEDVMKDAAAPDSFDSFIRRVLKSMAP